MMGIDTGFLIALSNKDHPSHGRAIEMFDKKIRGKPGTMALVPQVLSEFVHVTTDHRLFAKPLTMGEAMALARTFWHASECRHIATGSDAVMLFSEWMEEHRLGRKRILDTMLAASYYAAGVRSIATTDARDFSTFGVFEVFRC